MSASAHAVLPYVTACQEDFVSCDLRAGDEAQQRERGGDMAIDATMPTVVMSRACLLPACPASRDAQLTTKNIRSI
jgi:hypothetical protein